MAEQTVPISSRSGQESTPGSVGWPLYWMTAFKCGSWERREIKTNWFLIEKKNVELLLYQLFPSVTAIALEIGLLETTYPSIYRGYIIFRNEPKPNACTITSYIYRHLLHAKIRYLILCAFMQDTANSFRCLFWIIVICTKNIINFRQVYCF